LAALRATAAALERWMSDQAHLFVDITSSGLRNEHGYERIDRVDGHDAVNLSADLAPGVRIGDATDRIYAEVRRLFPPGVSLDLGGISADAQRTFTTFALLIALSIGAILAVLYALFRNFRDPLVISVALPLSIVGAFFALWVTRSDFGMISLMGVIFLLGLVNKNAILLVDAIKRLRADGLSRKEAILEAGSLRLRPIVMTTAATILGMLPIALGFGAGAELRAPMAIAIIGGLITSTLFSLIVVPVVYTIVDDRFKRKRLVVVAGSKAS
jgi:multidrug efflux pump subunit AcrB